MTIRIEVCQTNLSKQSLTSQVLTRLQKEFPEEKDSIAYVEMKCGGICAICKNTPYILVNKKFITGISQSHFYDNLKNYVLGIMVETAGK